MDEGTTVLAARCSSYGEGALDPFRKALLQLAGIDADNSSEVGREKLAALAPDMDRLVFETLAAFLGLSEQPGNIREAAWAIAQLCDSLALKKRLLVVVDDAHWADEALLELALELAADHEGALLVLVLSRPDLLEGEARPELSSAETIRLQPLVAEDQERVAREILGAEPPAELLRRLRQRAAGNPLYLEELLRGLAESGLMAHLDGELTTRGAIDMLAMPDSIEALLTSRVESLTALERTTLEAAAVAEGSIWTSSVAALHPERSEDEITAQIEALVERGFLMRTRSALPDQRQFRFSHILMREAAYGLIIKHRRAELHEALADWLQRTKDAELNLDGAIGRHLAATHDYRKELGAQETELDGLARRATGHLAHGGESAAEEGDYRIAADLLERASRFATSVEARAPILANLTEIRFRLGDFEAATEVAERAIASAATAGDVESEWVARSIRLSMRLVDDPGVQAVADARTGLTALVGTGHDWALTWAWGAFAYSLLNTGEAGAALKAIQQATEHETRSGRRRGRARALTSQFDIYVDGPANVAELERYGKHCLDELPELGETALLEGFALFGLGFAHGAQGRIEEARAAFGRSVEILDPLDPFRVLHAWTGWGLVELWAGELDRAETLFRRGCAIAEERAYMLNTLAALLGDVLARKGRFEEFEIWIKRAKAITSPEDVDPRVRWRYAAARARAEHDPEQAAALAAEATELADATDLTPLRAEAWFARAEVAVSQGHREQAVEAAHTAEALYRDKGILPAAATALELAERVARPGRVG